VSESGYSVVMRMAALPRQPDSLDRRQQACRKDVPQRWSVPNVATGLFAQPTPWPRGQTCNKFQCPATARRQANPDLRM